MRQLELPTDADDDETFMAKMTPLIEAQGGVEVMWGVRKHKADIPILAPWERVVDGIGEHLPPCLAAVAASLAAGEEGVGHAARFSLAAFLVKRQVPAEAIHRRFVNAPNYSEKVTEAQIQQIQARGYAPYSCSRMRSAGLCKMDSTCQERCLTSPMGYPIAG